MEALTPADIDGFVDHQIEAGMMPVNASEVDVRLLVGELSTTIAPILERNHLELRIDLAPDLHAAFVEGVVAIDHPVSCLVGMPAFGPFVGDPPDVVVQVGERALGPDYSCLITSAVLSCRLARKKVESRLRCRATFSFWGRTSSLPWESA